MSIEKSQSVDHEQEVGFPSAELIAAREAQGFTLQDVARELRLSEQYIDALERAAFDELPSMVFARGYIRSYTRLVNLDTERYLAVFDELYGEQRSGKVVMRTAEGIEQQAKLGDPVIKWSAWVFVLALIAASLWWWKNQQGAEQQEVALVGMQPVEVESADGSTVVVEPRPVIEVQPTPVTEAPESDAVTEVAVTMDEENATPTEPEITETATVATDTEQEAAAALQPTPQPVADVVEVSDVAEGTGSLRVTFTDECWVSVEDQSGEVLAMRVKPAGSELNVSGAAPLKVLLGKASAVDKVFFNGEPVNIDRATRSGVVRLTLPSSE